MLLPTVAAAQPAVNTVLVFQIGQSNGQTASTVNIEPPLSATAATGGGPPYSATFTASFSPTPLPAKNFDTAYPGIGTRAPSPNSGTMTVASVASGKIYAGETVSCAGFGTTLRITSDQFGAASQGFGLGKYVVDQQLTSGKTSCIGAQTDVGGGGTFLSNFKIWNYVTKAWQAYNPVQGPAQNSNTAGNGAGGTSRTWGPEAGFAANLLAANPNATLYMVKQNIGGTRLCPSAGAAGWAAPWGSVPGFYLRDLHDAVVAAEAALPTGGWTIPTIIWIQGERDAQDLGNFGCNAFGNGNYVYADNLIDLIDVLAIPAQQKFTAMGSISGDVLTVNGTPSDVIRPGDLVSGAGVPALGPNTPTMVMPYSATCNGVTTTGAGGAGTYCVQVFQIPPSSPVTLTDLTSGATVAGSAYRLSGRAIRIDAVTGGAVTLGDTLSAPGVLLPGTYISKLYDGSGAAGAYGINKSLSIASEALTFSAPGWGAGAGGGAGVTGAKFVISEVQNVGAASPDHEDDGVSRAQEYLNGKTYGVPIITIQRWDGPLNGLHDFPSFLEEEGRRIFRASVGQCDYTTATC
ncbi:MAG: hypothetical protein JOZ00_10920 [Mycobacterium sp.]|uniref:hypothetical protein n=1 Tax=Mycobacterium sp. TaxID=1785 RepID=UPI001ED54381|nr:hypothetical protein [Mycobacterium sp.]MBV8787189.1 hypothetical protein [Mycobacterium sp.]